MVRKFCLSISQRVVEHEGVDPGGDLRAHEPGLLKGVVPNLRAPWTLAKDPASAGKLAADLRLSSGAITNRLDRMEAAGLIRRLPDPNDRRGTLVEPTEKGHHAWDKTVGASARREAAATGVLSQAEKVQLHDLLRDALDRGGVGDRRPAVLLDNDSHVAQV